MEEIKDFLLRLEYASSHIFHTTGVSFTEKNQSLTSRSMQHVMNCGVSQDGEEDYVLSQARPNATYHIYSFTGSVLGYRVSNMSRVFDLEIVELRNGYYRARIDIFSVYKHVTGVINQKQSFSWRFLRLEDVKDKILLEWIDAFMLFIDRHIEKTYSGYVDLEHYADLDFYEYPEEKKAAGNVLQLMRDLFVEFEFYPTDPCL